VKLALLVFAIALATSRVGLILHEVVGHGVLAIVLGGHITGWSLHTFGGGWVAFARAEPWAGADAIAVQLGGIAIELVAAAIAALAARRLHGAAWLALAGAAWALAIHAAFYLAVGTFHGFGDGTLLHRDLGTARLAIVIPAALLACSAAYLAGVRLIGALRALSGVAAPRRQLAAVALALAAAGAAHAALTFGELRVRRDPRYGVVMQSERDRTVARELAERIAAAEAAGRRLAPPEVRDARRELERRHRELPFAPLLAAAIAAAVIAGGRRSPASRAPRVPSARALTWTVAIAASAVTLVVVLDHLPP